MVKAVNGIKRKFTDTSAMLKPSEILGPLPSVKELYKNQFIMAWPATVESVLVGIVGFIDMLMVSSLGDAAIAAVGITNQPKFLVLAFFMALNVGVTAVVSRRRGENRQEDANSTLRQTLLVALIMSVALSALAFVFSEPILRFAGSNDEIIEDACAYFRIILVGMPFVAVNLTVNAAQRSVGNTKISMITNISANVVNVIFNYFLIGGVWFFPEMGVEGAATATVLGNIVACFMSIASVRKKGGFLYLEMNKSFLPKKETMSSIVLVSSSAAVEQVFMRIGFFLFAKIVAELGTLEFATHQICINIVSMSFFFGDGLGVSTAALVGQSMGRKRTDIAALYVKMGLRLGYIVSVVLMLVFAFFGGTLVDLFTETEQVVSLGQQISYIIVFMCPAQVVSVILFGCLRGAGDTKFTAVVSLISIGVMRPVVSYILCFPMGFGLIGAWLGLCSDHVIRFFMGIARFASRKWKKVVL